MTVQETNASLPMLVRAEGTIGPRTLNAEARTVEVTWTVAGSVVRRQSIWEDAFDEELVVSEDAIDMARLSSGKAPLLATHQAGNLDAVVGVVEEAWLIGPKGRQEGRARVRFSKRAEVEPLVADIADGILRNVSVGYSVQEWTKTERKGDVPLMRATRWNPMEISLVPIGADPGARVRGEHGMYPCRVLVHEESTMKGQPADQAAEQAAIVDDVRAADPKPVQPAETPVQPPQPVPPPEPPAPPVRSLVTDTASAVADEVRAAVQAERERMSAIRAAARSVDLPEADADKLIADGVEIGEAKGRILDMLAGRQRGTDVRNQHISITRDEGETLGQALTQGLLARSHPGRKGCEVTDLVRERGTHQMSLTDVAREILEFHGIRTRGVPVRELVGQAFGLTHTRFNSGMHHTSDFANVLTGVLYTTLRDEYALAEPTYTAWASRATLQDYRPTNRVQLFGASRLKKVNEHGEYQRGTLTDGKESYQLVKYGEIIGITREIIINDYLGVFNRIPRALALAARSLESDIVYSILLANAAMADGTALFHANHANLGTTGVISATTIGEIMTLMATQVDPNSGSPFNFLPSYLLVPPAIRPAADTFVSGTFMPVTVATAVPAYMRNLTVVTEARLQTGITLSTEPDVDTTYAGSATTYFAVANPGQVDTVEYAYLEGSEGLYTEQRQGFDMDGVETKVRLDFGAKALDWRGMAKNVGA
jgi:hypothetical protein